MSDMPDYTHAIYTSVKNTWQDAENLDDTHGYITYIWIPEETYKVDLMKLHIYSEQFRAYSKSALDGGAVIKTTSEGGAEALTSGGGGADVITSGGGGADVITSSQTEVSHRHVFLAYQSDGGEVANRNFSCLNTASQAIVRSFATEATEDLYTYLAYTYHTHIVTIPNHTHGVTIPDHTHSVTIPNHTHTVTLTDHTHEINFGIYEEAITGRTLSAILYAPDGTELEDFGVVLTGEDSDILDLTDHFETLHYGMYKMVLTASGRLRARLVFYELCKMYAQY